MTWSLSKDDDGLDGLGPLEQPIAPAVDSGEARRVGFAPVTTADTSPSVVLDPIDETPQVPVFASPRARRAVEPTLVLKTRRLDELREEVKKRRVSHSRKKVKLLFLWAFAGGLALWLGAFAARTLLAPTVLTPLTGSIADSEGQQGLAPSTRVDGQAEAPRRNTDAPESPGTVLDGSSGLGPSRPTAGQVGSKAASAKNVPVDPEKVQGKKWLTAPWTEPSQSSGDGASVPLSALSEKDEPGVGTSKTKAKYDPSGLGSDTEPVATRPGHALTLDDLPSE